MRRPILLTGLVAVLFACGGSDGGEAGDDGPAHVDPDIQLPSSKVTVQQPMDLADFEAIQADSAHLVALGADLELTRAGHLEDSSGLAVDWAEGTVPTGGRRTLVRACRDGTCTEALQILAGGQLTWELGDGSTTEAISAGRPVLLKDLTGHQIKNDTQLAVGALSTAAGALSLDKDALPQMDFEHRRFVALNTFGPLFGTTLASVTNVVEAHGGFHEVVEIPYVREEAVVLALESLDALDAVVWLAQGVREETKDGWQASRTVGLTVNRGGYGDMTMTRDQLSDAADFNVAGGPGVVFLAASDSYGDGSEGQPDSGSIWSRLDDGQRILVGVEGHADVERMLKAATTFFDLFFSGDGTLAAAMEGANVHFQGTGSRLVTSAQDTSVTWLRRFEDIWSQVPFLPSSGQLIVPITAIPYCGPAQTPKTESHTQPFSEIEFHGAYMTGDRYKEFTDTTVDVHVRAVATGFSVGDRIMVEVWGDFDKDYTDYHGFGEGVIGAVETRDDGNYVIWFNGPAHTAPYTDGDGLECILNNPQISTTTGTMAQLVLRP